MPTLLEQLENLEANLRSQLRDMIGTGADLIRTRQEYALELQREASERFKLIRTLPLGNVESDQELVDTVVAYTAHTADLPQLKDALIYLLRSLEDEDETAFVKAYYLSTVIGGDAYDVLSVVLPLRSPQATALQRLLAAVALTAFYFREGGTLP